MTTYTGTISKLKTNHLADNNIEYTLPLGDELIPMNEFIGKQIKIEFDGVINCVATGKRIRKAYGQGYSWEAFNTLAQCDTCIFRPELCHFKKGTCREPEWGESHCLKPHVIYLANSSSLKVGITRQTQVPTRWMDQGASFALPICEVKDRLTCGLIEVKLAKTLGDKTNWRKMLSGNVDDIDLIEIKAKVLKDHANLFKKYEAHILDDKLYTFNYPVEEYPVKITSLNLDKKPIIEGKLMGIKGQYFIFDCGVINIRKFQGYKITFTC